MAGRRVTPLNGAWCASVTVVAPSRPTITRARPMTAMSGRSFTAVERSCTSPPRPRRFAARTKPSAPSARVRRIVGVVVGRRRERYSTPEIARVAFAAKIEMR